MVNKRCRNRLQEGRIANTDEFKKFNNEVQQIITLRVRYILSKEAFTKNLIGKDILASIEFQPIIFFHLKEALFGWTDEVTSNER